MPGVRYLSSGLFEDAKFSPDGTMLYVMRDDLIFAYRVSDGEQVATYDFDLFLSGIDISADGTMLVAGIAQQSPSGEYGFAVIDLTTGEMSTRLFPATDVPYAVHDVAILASDDILFSMRHGDDVLMLLDADDGTVSVAAEITTGRANLIESADGTTVFVVDSYYQQTGYVYVDGEGLTASVISSVNPYAGASVPRRMSGIGAISDDGSLIFEGDSGGLFDNDLNNQGSARLGLASGADFEETSGLLYVASGNNTVTAFSVATGEALAVYDIGRDVATGSQTDRYAYGDILQVDNDGSHLSLITQDGIALVDLSVIQPVSTSGDDVIVNGSRIYGLAGNDILGGSSEAQFMSGGPGDDIFYIDQNGDSASEGVNQGTDTVYLSHNNGFFSLGDNIEIVFVTHDLGGNVAGNNSDNQIYGGGGNDIIYGELGDDLLDGGAGNDTLIGGGGANSLYGGSGDDLFLYGLGDSDLFNPTLDAVIDGGADIDTIRVEGPRSGDVAWFTIGANLVFESIERLEFTREAGLIGTMQQLAAFEFIASEHLRVSDNVHVVPGGEWQVTYLSLTDMGASADLSGPGIYILNVIAGDGDDNIVGPDGGIANPSYNQQDLRVTIDVRAGNDVVVAGDTATVILSSGGNNHLTGSDFDDRFQLDGKGDNTVLAGGGNDEVIINGLGRAVVDGGAGDDVVTTYNFDADDQLSGGAGNDRLVLATAGEFDTQDLTGLSFGDFEVVETQGVALLTVAQINAIPQLVARYLAVADGGSITLADAPFEMALSNAGNTVDLSGETDSRAVVYGGAGNDIVYGGQEYNVLFGFGGDDALYANADNDDMSGGDGNDYLSGGAGNDVLLGDAHDDQLFGGIGFDYLIGGSHIDTAVFQGQLAEYTIEQVEVGVFQITGLDGTDLLEEVEYAQFDDGTIRLMPGSGLVVNFETADPSVYQPAMNAIRDFDGNALGGDGSWLRIGSADVDGDGDIDQILVNDAIGRFATVGGSDDGLAYFDDYGWAGETRVVGTYIDPLVASGDVVAGSDNDSQRRFQNDLEIENINRVLGADDYDGDGLQEVYLALTDGSAYLHLYMHADGNIQYANYQSEQQVIEYLSGNGFTSETWADWFSSNADTPSEKALVEQAALVPLHMSDDWGVEMLSLHDIHASVPNSAFDFAFAPANDHFAWA